MESGLAAPLPLGSKDLSVPMDSIIHVKFDEAARIRLDTLIVGMTWDDERNLFLPRGRIKALPTFWHMWRVYCKGNGLVEKSFKIDKR